MDKKLQKRTETKRKGQIRSEKDKNGQKFTEIDRNGQGRDRQKTFETLYAALAAMKIPGGLVTGCGRFGD